MFLTYLRRELRRRARQAILISLGLALGVGLVITVTAASAGVRNAQSDVLHSLYGVGTDITVTQVPKAGTGGPGRFGFGFSGGTGTRPAPGTKFSDNRLTPGRLGPIGVKSVTSIAKLPGVAAATGALTLNDVSISGTIPAGSGGFGGGARRGFITPATFTVAGVDLSTGAIGPLSAGKISSGRTFAVADANAAMAVVDASYAAQNKLKVGSTVSVGSSAGKPVSFSVIGIVSTPGTSSDVYIPLTRAQSLAGLRNQVNIVYVAAASSSAISGVRREISALLPKATVTTASSLASEVTGSLADASSLANDLGRWLAVAVLVAAFALAALLTMAAVSRRVREFGTLKALGWRSRRVVGQVMGEALVVGVVGGIAGVALGFGGAALIGRLAPSLTATVGQTTGSATPGGQRVFGGLGGGGFPGSGAFRRLTTEPTVTVHLNPTVTFGVVAAAVLLAVLGGLIAGGFGSWRAARLRPAAALARVA